MTNSISKALFNLNPEEIDVMPGKKLSARKDFAVVQTICLLKQSHWLNSNTVRSSIVDQPSSAQNPLDLPTPTTQLLKMWTKSVKEQEHLIAQA